MEECLITRTRASFIITKERSKYAVRWQIRREFASASDTFLRVVSRLEHVDYKHSGEICFHSFEQNCASVMQSPVLMLSGKLVSPCTMLPGEKRPPCWTSGAKVTFMYPAMYCLVGYCLPFACWNSICSLMAV